jgi:hypothetical protein
MAANSGELDAFQIIWNWAKENPKQRDFFKYPPVLMEIPPSIGNKVGQNRPTSENMVLRYKDSINRRDNKEFLIAKDSDGNTG